MYNQGSGTGTLSQPRLTHGEALGVKNTPFDRWRPNECLAIHPKGGTTGNRQGNIIAL